MDDGSLLLVEDALHLVDGFVDLLLDLACLLLDRTGLAVRSALRLQVPVAGRAVLHYPPRCCRKLGRWLEHLYSGIHLPIR